MTSRVAQIKRQTTETSVELRLDLSEHGVEPCPVTRRVVVASRLVQGGRVSGTLSRQPFQDDLDVHPEVPGDLARAGSTAVALPELGCGVVDLRLQLAQPAGHPDGHGPVAEMPQHLSGDGGDGKFHPVAAGLSRGLELV